MLRAPQPTIETLLQRADQIQKEIKTYQTLVDTPEHEQTALLNLINLTEELARVEGKTTQLLNLNAFAVAEEKDPELEAALKASLMTTPPLSFAPVEEKKEVAPAPAKPAKKSGELVYYNPISRPVPVKPIRTFKDAEKKVMTDYLEFLKSSMDTVDRIVNPLIEATIWDELFEVYNFSPAFVIPEGLINTSLETLTAYFETQHPFVDRNDPTNKVHPIFQKTPTADLPCTIHDVIPCNTLLRAIEILLDKATKWKNKDNSEPDVPELKEPAEKRQYSLPGSTGLTRADVDTLETIYRYLPASRQLMFNCIVRDLRTGQIMHKAVQLTDGEVLDESDAIKLLKQISPPGEFPAIYEGQCPSDPRIKFKVVKDENGVDLYSEMKPALYYNKVVELLKAHAAAFKEHVNVEQQATLRDPNLQRERGLMQVSSASLLNVIAAKKMELQPETTQGVINKKDETIYKKLCAQENVVRAAINALNNANCTEFDTAVKANPDYRGAVTKFGGIQTGNSMASRIYLWGAQKTGTIKGQETGLILQMLVPNIQDLLHRCEADRLTQKAQLNSTANSLRKF